jgi:hypothetical protein
MRHEQYNRRSGYSSDHASSTIADDLHRDDRQTPPPVDSRPARAKFGWQTAVAIGVVIILALCAAATLSKQFRHQIEISIVRQRNPYTQLYFTDPKALPAHLKVNKNNVFEFTIENNEGREFSYTYTVTLADSRSHAVASKATTTISDGQRTTRQVAVQPKDLNSTYLITVTLQGANQSIHFYATTTS